MLSRNPEAALRDRISELEEENRQLREILSPLKFMLFPAEWLLTEAERRVLAAIYSSADNFLSHDGVLAAIKPRNGGISLNYSTVMICKLRCKLEPLGIEFINRHRYGYRLTAASRALIEMALK